MKALGIVSLLVVLAVVGLLASQKMSTAPLSVPAELTGGKPVTGTTAEQSRQLQEQVRTDMDKALEQAAAAREAADK